jgi:non-specific protein-tyrosine kinase
VELREYLSVLARRKHLVLAVIAATLAVAVALTMLQAPKWKGRATLRVEPSSSLVGGSVQADDVEYLDRLINTYSRLATSDEMSDRVTKELRLGAPPTIDFRQLPNTNLVRLEVITSDRATAAPAASRVASLLISEVETIAGADAATSERAFQRRTRQLESEKAKAQAELDGLTDDPASARSERALLLRERISGMTQRLAAQRADHERYQSTREANVRAVSVIAEPTTPRRAESRNLKLVIAVALLAGAMAGLALAFLAENLSRRFRNREEIEASVDAPVLSAVPVVDGTNGRVLFDSRSAAEEAFRRLRTTLLLQRSGDRFGAARTILITSAYPGEGKSTVVANLGRSLAQSGQSTLLIDADLRRPVLHTFFGIENVSGLSDILRGAPPLDRSTGTTMFRPTGIPGLTLLPAGDEVDDAATLLGFPWASSAQFVELADQYEYVLVDTPAVLSVPDAIAATRNVDGVLLVAGSNVKRDALRYAHEQLTRASAEVLGVVLNGVDDANLYPYVDYGPRLEEPKARVS